MATNDKVSIVRTIIHENFEWKSLLEGWIKVNYNATLDKEHLRGAVVVFARNGEGFLVDACDGCEVGISIEHLDLLDVLKEIKMASTWVQVKVVLKVDSSEVASWIAGVTRIRDWRLIPILQDTVYLLSLLHFFELH